MKKFCATFLLCFTLLNSYNTTAQTKAKTDVPISFQEYEQKVNRHKQDTLLALKYAQEWLTFSKEQNNVGQQLKAYQSIMHLVDKKFRMIYGDSLRDTAHTTNDDALIGSAHLTIGAAYYNDRELNKALDQYLLANEYISKTEDVYLKSKLKYTLAQTKYHLGFYEEARELFLDCLQFFKDYNDTAYIKSLHALAVCNTRIGRYDRATYYNESGMELATRLEILEMIPYFKNAEGINQHKLNNHMEAIPLLLESLPAMEENKDKANQIMTWFYLGKSYLGKNETKTALEYFNKVGQAIDRENFVHPELREAYEILLESHTMKNELEQQLLTIEKLLAYDTQLHTNYKYLSYKIHKEYDTKTLQHKKQAIQEELASSKIRYIGITIILSLFVLGLTTYHLCNKKIQKQKFNHIIQEMASKKKPESNVANPIENISPEITQEVLKNLEKFEATNKFIEKDITLTKLATLLNTNTKYASLIISHYRSKKTTTYINDLKIEYVVTQLMQNKKYRNYTNKALAEEVGFGSTQIFTKCFKSKIGMSPTAFIHQLKSAKDENR